MARAQIARTRPPTRPGSILREDVLPPLGLSVAEAARELHISRQTLHRVLAGLAAITPEMAVRLGKLCGNGPTLWLCMQQAHDLWHAERELVSEVSRIRTHKRAAQQAALSLMRAEPVHPKCETTGEASGLISIRPYPHRDSATMGQAVANMP